MKVFPVYTIPFSFHICVGFCLYENTSLCSAMAGCTVCSLHPPHILRSSTPNEWEALRIDNEIPYSVDTGFDRLHDIGLVSCHFQSVFMRKLERGMKLIRLVPSINRRPIRSEMKAVSSKQKANPI